MSKSSPSIPKKGSNPAQLKAALSKKHDALMHALARAENLTKMVTANASILGQLVVMFEVLKDKGIITNEEINNKFKDLEAKRKQAEDDKEKAARKALDTERDKLAHPERTESSPEVSGDSSGAKADAKVIDFNKIHIKGSSVQPEESRGDESNQ
jgi:hypothetical protein